MCCPCGTQRTVHQPPHPGHPVRDVLFLARRQAGVISTAAAVHNVGAESMVATCQLMQAGAVLEEVAIPLAANGQESQYIEEMFTFTGADVSDFVGSVRCTVPPGEGMFTGVAVEIDEGNRIFTTLPVVPVTERDDFSGIDKGSDPVVQGLSRSREEGGGFCFLWLTLKRGKPLAVCECLVLRVSIRWFIHRSSSPYYLFFNYLSYYLYMFPECSKNRR